MDQLPGIHKDSTAEQEQAVLLIQQGMPLRQVAQVIGVSYDVVRRAAKTAGIEFRRSERKLTPSELQEAYRLLQADTPLREVARRYQIHPESLRRLALRDGVNLRPKGEKLTPTQRKLTPAQRKEACALVWSGLSIRCVSKQFGVSRQALGDLLKREERRDLQ